MCHKFLRHRVWRKRVRESTCHPVPDIEFGEGRCCEKLRSHSNCTVPTSGFTQMPSWSGVARKRHNLLKDQESALCDRETRYEGFWSAVTNVTTYPAVSHSHSPQTRKYSGKGVAVSKLPLWATWRAWKNVVPAGLEREAAKFVCVIQVGVVGWEGYMVEGVQWYQELCQLHWPEAFLTLWLDTDCNCS